MTVASDQASPAVNHVVQAVDQQRAGRTEPTAETVVERVADAWQIGGGTSEHILCGMTDRQREAFTADPVFGPVVAELRTREAGHDLEAGE
jgi:1,4-dihydroxy-2-naphthoyl-CoA synthase